MSVTWLDRLRCWLRGTHRFEWVTTPSVYTYRLCRSCGFRKEGSDDD